MKNVGKLHVFKKNNLTVRCAGLLIVLLVLTGLIGGGCEKGGNNQFLTEADNGGWVVMSVGYELEISLAGNPTTGYQWEVGSYNSQVLELMSDPRYVPDAGSADVGVGGRYYIKFKALHEGETRVELLYRRPSEKNAEQSFVTKVTVY